MKKPKCPTCVAAGAVEPRKHVIVINSGRLFRCTVHGMFDHTPNEGGDYMADPSARMELAESRAQRRSINR